MEKIYINNIRKLKENKETIEEKLGVVLKIKGKQVSIEAEPVEQYEASLILEAIDFGFPLRDALTLASENMIFRKLPIKNFTRRKDLKEVRGRIIGTEGKTKRAMENVSGCAVVLHENTVGIIGPAESIEEATTALGNLIHGSKQANIYAFLEKMNREKRKKTDLGLKLDKEETKEQ